MQLLLCLDLELVDNPLIALFAVNLLQQKYPAEELYFFCTSCFFISDELTIFFVE